MHTSPRRNPARNSTAVTFWQEMRACEERGDRYGYMRARTDLYELFERLSFRYVSSLFGHEWLSPEDIRQECRLAVIQAIDHWNPDRGEFPVLLSFYTRRRVRDYLRNNELIRRSQSVFDQHGQDRCQDQEHVQTARLPVVSLDSDEREEWLSVAADDPYGRIQMETAVAQALDYLDEEARHVVALHFGLNGCDSHTYRQMGPLLGCSAQYAHERVRKALPVLAAALEGAW